MALPPILAVLIVVSDAMEVSGHKDLRGASAEATAVAKSLIQLDAALEHRELMSPPTNAAHAASSQSGVAQGPLPTEFDQWFKERLRATKEVAKRVLTASPASIFAELTGHQLLILRQHDSASIHNLIAIEHQEWTIRRFCQYLMITLVVGSLALLQLRHGLARKGSASRFMESDDSKMAGPRREPKQQVELSGSAWACRRREATARKGGPEQPMRYTGILKATCR
mmetsp:Transcript_30079/g.93768  ORF Transcript_30079/g.93768 Transcript_30079/m.93768 type:complete len:226 (+) Transcript_30079:80-757(+)